MKHTRREFLKKSGCALGMTALAGAFEHFGLMSALAQSKTAQNASSGGNYKALVCVFLEGGNDGNNTIIPNHNDKTLSNYSVYHAARAPYGLAIAQNTLLPFTVPRMGNLSYGFHPSLGAVQNGVNNGIYELWAQRKMAVVANCGSLVQPMTKTQFENNTVPKPFQLYSHLDQIMQSHTSRADVAVFSGWGGKMSDRMTDTNNPNGLIPMITSVSGAQLFTAGQATVALEIADAETPLNQVFKPTGFGSDGISQARLSAYNQLRRNDLDLRLVAAASAVTDQAIQANNALVSYQEVTVPFPNTDIGNQLKQVARLIKKRGDLNVQRQIFYCQLNGFDTHDKQVGDHSRLLAEFSQAVRAFYDEMVVQGVSNNVTTFTMSDFGRTFNPAGTGATVGSDHAWGNHLFVLGGAILGGDFYGGNTPNGTPYPTLQFDGPDDADSGSTARGRWIPTTSVEQYAATLARWFGLSDADMPAVFPNIGNFANTNLGFMQL